MSEGTGIEAAIKRLQVALDTLEAASERKLESEQREAALTEQVHVLTSDRAQLAAKLGGQMRLGNGQAHCVGEA